MRIKVGADVAHAQRPGRLGRHAQRRQGAAGCLEALAPVQVGLAHLQDGAASGSMITSSPAHTCLAGKELSSP